MNMLNTNCAGIARRDFIQLGVGGVFGLGMSDLIRLRAEAARAVGKASPDQVNCILVWLDGGPTVAAGLTRAANVGGAREL